MKFKKAVIFSLLDDSNVTINGLITLVEHEKIEMYLEESTAEKLDQVDLPTVAADAVDASFDVIIVIGGDGSMLAAARQFWHTEIPLLGINRGHIGFLVTHNPSHLDGVLQVLKGEYHQESRMMLNIKHEGATHAVLNECIFSRRETGRLVELQLYLENQFLSSIRADGLIIATPTGSTAYAMSAGGPIINPNIQAMLIVPICPHKLSSRPIVIPADSRLRVEICESNRVNPVLGCDGQDKGVLKPGERITVEKHSHVIKLLHAPNYEYYKNLREKLNWEEQFYPC